MGVAWMRMQIRIWQALCVLCPLVPPPDTGSTLQKIFTVLQVHLPAIFCSQWHSSRARCMLQPACAAPGLALYQVRTVQKCMFWWHGGRCPFCCPADLCC